MPREHYSTGRKRRSPYYIYCNSKNCSFSTTQPSNVWISIRTVRGSCLANTQKEARCQRSTAQKKHIHIFQLYSIFCHHKLRQGAKDKGSGQFYWKFTFLKEVICFLVNRNLLIGKEFNKEIYVIEYSDNVANSFFKKLSSMNQSVNSMAHLFALLHTRTPPKNWKKSPKSLKSAFVVMKSDLS